MRLRPHVALVLLLLLLLLLLTAACSDGGGDDVAFDRRSDAAASSTTTATSTTTTTTPAASGGGAPVPRAAGQAATASCPAVPARAEPRGDRSRYTLRIDVRPAENAVVGDVAVRFTPDKATDVLVFRLWPNGPRPAGAGARLETGQVTVAGRAAESRLDNPTTLSVRTGGTFAAGAPVDVTVPWRLTLPGAVNDRISRSGDSIRLGSFFPVLAWEPGVGWATEPATSGFSESAMTPPADFTATVTVPSGLNVLATGVQDGQARWTATAVPDFAMSVGRFTLESTTVDAPHPVVLTVGVQQGIAESPAPYIDKLSRVLRDFSARFGPYPWPTYTLAVTPGLSGGIEFPMHFMQGPGRIGRTTSHEAAHAWFYGLVHSNQGRDPWIDEGLATYAETRYERTEAAFRARAIPADGRGRLGEPMTYWEQRQSSYYRSVYVQGAQALMALGPLDRVDCALRHVSARLAYRVARSGDVIAALATVFPDAGAVLARYGVRS